MILFGVVGCLLQTCEFTAAAFVARSPSPPSASGTRGPLRGRSANDRRHPPNTARLASEHAAADDGGGAPEKYAANDVLDWFLREPESPIFMAMVSKMARDTWAPIKYQLDRVPVFYCGAEGVRPADLPFPCFLDPEDARAHLRSLGAGRGFSGGASTKGEGAPGTEVVTMLLGDAYENAAMGHSAIRPRPADQRAACELSGVENLSEDPSFVPVFGIRTLVRANGGVVEGLTDRLYFNAGQARRILEQVKDQHETEDEAYELFAVSLGKSIEYMILDEESKFRFEYVPPEASLDYLASKYPS